MPVDFNALQADDEYFVRLDQNVWLMDNHKWAICAWEAHRVEGALGRLNLVHVDYHWDGVDDYHGERSAQRALRAADLDALMNLVLADQFIRLDSFVAAAVRRRMLSEIHFLCRQQVGIHRDLLRLGGVSQRVHGDLDQLGAANVAAPYVLDLCLDYFCDSNQMGEGPIWDDAEVIATMESLRLLVEGAGAVTVSLSFDFSGTAGNTQHLASLVLPRVMAWRAAA